jgi:hypothetical protein
MYIDKPQVPKLNITIKLHKEGAPFYQQSITNMRLHTTLQKLQQTG